MGCRRMPLDLQGSLSCNGLPSPYHPFGGQLAVSAGRSVVVPTNQIGAIASCRLSRRLGQTDEFFAGQLPPQLLRRVQDPVHRSRWR